jgi:hypothetical protein
MGANFLKFNSVVLLMLFFVFTRPSKCGSPSQGAIFFYIVGTTLGKKYSTLKKIKKISSKYDLILKILS